MAYIANLPCVSAGKLDVICLSILRYTFHFVSVGDDQAVIVLSVTKTWLAATNLLITEAYGKQDVTIRLIHCVGLLLPFQTSTSTALIIVCLKIGQWAKITSLTLSMTAKSSGTWGMFSYIFRTEQKETSVKLLAVVFSHHTVLIRRLRCMWEKHVLWGLDLKTTLEARSCSRLGLQFVNLVCQMKFLEQRGPQLKKSLQFLANVLIVGLSDNTTGTKKKKKDNDYYSDNEKWSLNDIRKVNISSSN